MRAVLLYFVLLLHNRVATYHTFGPAVYTITPPVEHADGLTWDKRSSHLYYADVYAGRLYSYNPDNGKSHYVQFSGTVGPIVQTKCDANRLVVGLNRSVLSVTWNGVAGSYKQKLLTVVSKEFPDSRLSAGRADRLGRLWFGTTGREIGSYVIPNHGNIYLMTKRNFKTPKVQLGAITTANGVAWNKANNKLYHVDTENLQIAQYDYKESTAALTSKKTLYSVIEELGDVGAPSGLAVDKLGNLWVGVYGGGCVLQVNANSGKLIRRVALPAKYITSVAWGGNNFDVLFVASSRRKLSTEERKTESSAGSLFAVTDLGVTGVPVYEADFC